MTATKGKIGVLIEEHFDATQVPSVQRVFPAEGYEVEYLSHLWGSRRCVSAPIQTMTKWMSMLPSPVNSMPLTLRTIKASF